MAQDLSNHVPRQKSAAVDPTPLSAIRKRKQKVSNLWIFESPKNNRRLTVSGDVPFMHLVLLEGDIAVAGYDLIDDPFNVTSAGDSGYVRIRLRDGGQHWLLIGRHGRKKPGKADKPAIPEQLHERAAAAGVEVYRRTELELIGQEILFDNWLTLCAIMTRACPCPSYLETQLLLATLDRHESLRVCDVLGVGNADPAIMLAVVAKALQSGIVQTELSKRLFGMHSQLKRVRS